MLIDADEVTGLALARSGVYPAALSLTPTEVHQADFGDETFTIGAATVRCMPTPGHAVGHACYLVDVDGARAVFHR